MERSAGPAGPAGAAQEEHLLLLRKATAAGLLLEHMYVLVCICIHLVAERAPTRRLPLTSPSLAGWQGGCGERGTCTAVSIIPLGSCSGGSLAGRTAASASSCWACWRYKNALLRLKNALLCCPSLIRALQRGCTVESLEDPSGSSPFEDDMVLHSDGRDAISVYSLRSLLVGHT